MTTTPPADVLVTISVPPTLDEPLIDWLLERESGPGFTSYDIRGHSSEHGHLSVAEQVSGRQKRKRFEIALAGDNLPGFLEELSAAFRGTDLYYWVTPIIASDHL